MKRDNNLQFIASVISDLGTSVFHDYSDTFRKIRSGIADTIKVDDEGNIWAMVNNAGNENFLQEDEIPVGLHYYKKDKPFYLNISGKVVMGQQGFDKEGYRVLSDNILLRIKILKAEFFDLRKRSLAEKIKNQLHKFYNNLFRMKESGTVIHRLAP